MGKIGKSTLFNQHRWGPIGGDNEAPLTMLALAKEYPQHDFYIIGRAGYKSDYTLPSNLINVLGEYSKLVNKNMSELAIGSDPWEYQTAICRYFEVKKIKIDFGILHFGSTFGCSTFQNRLTKKGEWMKTTCAATNYQGMMIETLNQLEFKWLGIVTDPRQLKPMQDLYNYPKVLLSQIDEDWKFKSKMWKNGQSWDQDHSIPQVYAGVENMSFMMYDGIKPIAEKTTLFGMIQNEGLKRGPILEKFGILGRDDTIIYGKWDEKWTNKYPKNLVGTIKPEDINDKIAGWKYTFCVPIDSGWMTLKYNEMLHNGVFPFLHHTYANKVKNHNILPFFFVKDKEELWSKIAHLEANPNEYYQLMFKARKRLPLSVYDGKFICDTIKDAVKLYLKEDM